MLYRGKVMNKLLRQLLNSTNLNTDDKSQVKKLIKITLYQIAVIQRHFKIAYLNKRFIQLDQNVN